MSPSIDLILFDLGGVLVELGGVARMMEWTGRALSEEQLWRRWYASPAVRLFETGKISPETFAGRLVAEFRLHVGKEQCLTEYITWSKGPYPGARDLLAALSASHRLACLTNTNSLHWERVVGQMGIIGYFDCCFPSHLTGFVKPDAAAFTHVIDRTGCAPASILFLDDSQDNVDAAAALGIAARRVRGVAPTTALLKEMAIIDDREVTP